VAGTIVLDDEDEDDDDDDDDDDASCPFEESSSEYPSEDEEDGPEAVVVEDLDRDVEQSADGSYLISKDEFCPDHSTTDGQTRTRLGERMNDMEEEDVDKRVSDRTQFSETLKRECKAFMGDEVKKGLLSGMEKLKIKARSVRDVALMWAQLRDKKKRVKAGKKLVRLIKVGGSLKKGWEVKAAETFMTKK
jgi:hypothetical protein